MSAASTPHLGSWAWLEATGGALFHDVGLEHPEPGRCFTHTSAARAHDAAADALPPERLEALADGIGMHITPGLTTGESLVGFYLQAGAMADLGKLRLWELPAALRARAQAAAPQAGAGALLSACWRREPHGVPAGRAAVIERWSCFSALVRALG